MKITSVTDGQYRICSKILQKDKITHDDFIYTKNLLYKHIHEDNLSPREINEKYNLGYKDFGCPLKHNFKIKLKSLKEAMDNYRYKNNIISTDEKELYRKNCQFNFNPYQETKIIGYELLEKYSFSTPQNKEKGKLYLHRDHMVSVAYGWENNIPPEHISHPANCELLFEIDNIKKGSGCSITYEELLLRIEKWNTDEKLLINNSNILKQPKNELHKKAVSNRMINGVIYNNGKNFKYILPGEEIPTGFVLGKLEICDDNGNKLFNKSGRKYGFDIINNERIKLGLLPLEEKYRNTLLASKKLCKKFNIDFLSFDIKKEVVSIQNRINLLNISSLCEIFKCVGLSSTNPNTKKLYKNFMKL